MTDLAFALYWGKEDDTPMRYNPLGPSGAKVSIIGLGTEHCLGANDLAPVVHAALDHGINYMDVIIWAAKDKNRFAAALRGHRDDVLLAAHIGVAETNGQYRRTRDPQECEELWNGWLARLGTDHLDVGHLHYVDQLNDYEQMVAPGGVLELAQRLKRQGKVRLLSLSGHNPEVAMRAVEDGILDVVMHPIGIGQAFNPRVTELCELCARRGVAVVVMKTFAGGELLQRERPPSPAQCIHYSLAQPGVATVLVGPKNVKELEADLTYLDASAEEKDYAAAVQEFRGTLQGTCVYCSHCLPCPAAIDIALVMNLYAAAKKWGVDAAMGSDYASLPAKASSCVECGECMERCPFGVDVIAQMRETVELFGA